LTGVNGESVEAVGHEYLGLPSSQVAGLQADTWQLGNLVTRQLVTQVLC